MAWRGFELTAPLMRDPKVRAIKNTLFQKFTWARLWPGFAASHDDADTADVYDRVTSDVIASFQSRTGMIDAGTAKAGVCNFATQVRLGVVASGPPKPGPRHACLTFRGTGGIIGQDYTSIVAQACSSHVEEIPVHYPAAMGLIPVGAAADPVAPSGYECANIAVEWAVDWFDHNPTRTVVIGGYSLGAIAASRVRAEMLPGGRLADFADNFVCAFTFGNPSRAFGHTFFLGAVPAGEGISDFHLPEKACGWEWCDEVDALDMYGNVPLGQVGTVMRDAYNLVMNTQVHDPIALAGAMIPILLKILDDAGIQLPLNIPGIITGAFAGLLAGLLPGIIPGGDAETAAAVQAAIIALKFYADQPTTRAHITYQDEQAMPGQSHLAHAIQHVSDWSSRVPVRL
ncbi:hypothetical protein BH09ACT8_BH09ACT8_33790 [soil metagenome]